MKTIYKYPLPMGDHVTINLPKGARILTVQIQGELELPFLWALVDPQESMEQRCFRIVGTGQNIHNPDELKYIATFQMLGGRLMLHAFEEQHQRANAGKSQPTLDSREEPQPTKEGN